MNCAFSVKKGDNAIAPPASPRIVGLIPARLASTRLPDKPLVDISGWPMLRHVYERARRAKGMEEVAIATPDRAIADVARGFGARVLMTAATHLSGTDRLAEAARLLQLDNEAIVVNIQGDEPLLDPADIESVFAPLCAERHLPMSSLMCPCPRVEWDNPACVKVVCAQNGDALYFSRARLPFPRNPSDENSDENDKNAAIVMQHIGLYAYRSDFLQTYANLPPTPLEQMEGLEQLRVLENGYRIRMVRVENAPVGVDTPDDLARARQILAGFSPPHP